MKGHANNCIEAVSYFKFVLRRSTLLSYNNNLVSGVPSVLVSCYMGFVKVRNVNVSGRHVDVAGRFVAQGFLRLAKVPDRCQNSCNSSRL